MPPTHLPNGLSVQAASATNSNVGPGAIGAVDDSVFGQTTIVTYTFNSVSTAQVTYLAVPFDGSITAAYVISGATVTVTTGHTVRVGSAGSIAVATVANTSGVAGGSSSLATTTTSVTTADSIQITRAACGTTGNTSIGIKIVRA